MRDQLKEAMRAYRRDLIAAATTAALLTPLFQYAGNLTWAGNRGSRHRSRLHDACPEARHRRLARPRRTRRRRSRARRRPRRPTRPTPRLLATPPPPVAMSHLPIAVMKAVGGAWSAVGIAVAPCRLLAIDAHRGVHPASAGRGTRSLHAGRGDGRWSSRDGPGPSSSAAGVSAAATARSQSSAATLDGRVGR